MATPSMDEYSRKTLPAALKALEDQSKVLAGASTAIRDSFDRASDRARAVEETKQVRAGVWPEPRASAWSRTRR